MRREVVMTQKSGKAGRRLRVSSAEARALVALGHAEYVGSGEAPAAPAPKATKRTYNRRDMTAAAPQVNAAASPSGWSSYMVTKSSDGEAA